jgi:hypothetical protein
MVHPRPNPEAERALVNELETWAPRLAGMAAAAGVASTTADAEDEATCWRQDRYLYNDCRAELLAIRRECAQAGDFFDIECD